MTPGLGRRAGAAAALVLGVLLCTPASPAGAAPLRITVDPPAENATLDSASVTIGGTATASDILLDIGLITVKRVTLTLQPGSKTLLTKDCTTKTCTFTYTASLPMNGPYTVTASATESQLGNESEPTTTSRKFAVAAPAARPVLDTPRVTDGRTVELSWSRNTEGDMLYYVVFRKDPGASKYFQVGSKVNQPASGSKVTFVDTTTSTFGGGDYSYQVVAVRKGATADSEKPSEPSAAAAASVPLPPTTTATSAPVPGSPAAGPTTTVKPGPPGGVDLSGFLSARSQPITLPTITVPEPPDTGFNGTLPFGARPPADELEEGDAEATPPGRTDGSSIVSLDAGRPLVPVAGGLVLLLLALHMRLLGRRIKAPADADLPVVAVPVPPAPGPVAVVPAPAAAAADPEPDREPEPEPQPRFYDISAEEDWAPPPAEPEPAPEPDPEPEPEPEPEVVTMWAPEPPEEEPDAPAFNPDEIEVFEVVSSTRRRLVRAGGR